MIKRISIKNFKCFKELTTFEFSKLNLLTGINGRGKSSLLQSILILSQSARSNPRFNNLIINDELVSLGNYDDIKNSETLRSEKIIIKFDFDNPSINNVKAEYSELNSNELVAKCDKFELTTNGETEEIDLNNPKSLFTLGRLRSFFCRVHFVSADRQGAVKFVEKTNLPRIVQVGSRGEKTINILANSDNLRNVYDNLYLGKDSKSLIQQTIEWLNYILDGAKIEIKGREKESSVLYMLLNNKNNSYRYKSANVGYGYSYILPLIVTGLIANKNETIIVENPEAHLHPRAQTRIAEFFSRVASCGIQVFIESHSEHILNGLRVSAINSEIEINNNDMSFHYFNERFASEKLEMDEYSNIKNWPIGFFDQQDIDLATIFKATL